jgi:hypothetical protein
MQQTMDRGTNVRFPVDNATYDLLMTLSNKLQALEAYGKYANDSSGREQELYRQLIDEDTRHAERIYEALKERIGR